MPSCCIAAKSSVADEIIRFGQNFVSLSREGGHGSVVPCQRGETATAECSLRGEGGSDYYSYPRHNYCPVVINYC